LPTETTRLEAVPTLNPEEAVVEPQPVSWLRLNHFKWICMYNSRRSLVFYFFSNASAGFTATRLLVMLFCCQSDAIIHVLYTNVYKVKIAVNMKNHEKMVDTSVCFHANSSKDRIHSIIL